MRRNKERKLNRKLDIYEIKMMMREHGHTEKEIAAELERLEGIELAYAG